MLIDDKKKPIFNPASKARGQLLSDALITQRENIFTIKLANSLHSVFHVTLPLLAKKSELGGRQGSRGAGGQQGVSVHNQSGAQCM